MGKRYLVIAKQGGKEHKPCAFPIRRKLFIGNLARKFGAAQVKPPPINKFGGSMFDGR